LRRFFRRVLLFVVFAIFRRGLVTLIEAIVRIPETAGAIEGADRHALDAGPDRKQAAGERLAGQSGVFHAGGTGCDEQRIQIGPAKGATGGARDRQIDDPVNHAFRGEPDNAAAVPANAPQTTIRIDGQSVRPAGRLTGVHGNLAPAQRPAVALVVELEDGAAGAVGDVEILQIGAPPQAVGHRKARHHGGADVVRAKLEHLPGVAAVALVHGADPEPVVRPAFAVVEVEIRAVRFRFADDVVSACCRIEDAEAEGHGSDQAAG